MTLSIRSKPRVLAIYSSLETITPREFIERFSSEAREPSVRQYQYLDLIDKDISNFPKDSYGDAYTELPFDLTRFTLIDVNEKIVFRFTFRELGGNPWGGPNGWSFQQIHV
ncbi:MAG: glucodextranase DOMON-like domain-containing protein, partial [Ignisphaera sp.]